MVILKFLAALLFAAVLAAVALVSGCTFDPGSGATGNLELTTPFGNLKSNFKVVPGTIPPPYSSPPLPDRSTLPEAPEFRSPGPAIVLWQQRF